MKVPARPRGPWAAALAAAERLALDLLMTVVVATVGWRLRKRLDRPRDARVE